MKEEKKKRQEAQKAFFSWDLGWFYEEIGTELVNTDHLCWSHWFASGLSAVLLRPQWLSMSFCGYQQQVKITHYVSGRVVFGSRGECPSN